MGSGAPPYSSSGCHLTAALTRSSSHRQAMRYTEGSPSRGCAISTGSESSGAESPSPRPTNVGLAPSTSTPAIPCTTTRSLHPRACEASPWFPRVVRIALISAARERGPGQFAFTTTPSTVCRHPSAAIGAWKAFFSRKPYLRDRSQFPPPTISGRASSGWRA